MYNQKRDEKKNKPMKSSQNMNTNQHVQIVFEEKVHPPFPLTSLDLDFFFLPDLLFFTLDSSDVSGVPGSRMLYM